MDDIVGRAVDAIASGDWDVLRPLLHPYLRWTLADGRTIRGRTNVLAHLAVTPAPPPPKEHELRDGQIYRWVT